MFNKIASDFDPRYTPQLVEQASSASRVWILAGANPLLLDASDAVLRAALEWPQSRKRDVRVLMLDPKPSRDGRSQLFFDYADVPTPTKLRDDLSARSMVMRHFLYLLQRVGDDHLSEESDLRYMRHIPPFEFVLLDDELLMPTPEVVGGVSDERFLSYFGSIFECASRSSQGRVTDSTISAGGIVIGQYRGVPHVALAQRTSDHKWVLPQGHRLRSEPADNLTVTAKREVEEETGLSRHDLQFGDVRCSYEEPLKGDPSIVRHIFLFHVKYVSGITTRGLHPGAEHRTVEWHPLSDLPDLKYEKQREVLEDIARTEGKP